MERQVGRTDWEGELRRLASGEAHITLPNAAEIAAALQDINAALGGTTNDGLEGTTAVAAAAAFDTDAQHAQILRGDLVRITTAVDRMNEDRQRIAQHYLADLDARFPAKLDGWNETLLRGATVGSTWMLGPFSFVVADGVVGKVNELLASQRREQARAGVQAVCEVLDRESASFDSERRIARKGDQGGRGDEGGSEEVPSTPGGGSNGPGTNSFDTYPDSGQVTPLPPGFTYDPPRTDDTDNPDNPTYPNPTFPNPWHPDGPGDDSGVCPPWQPRPDPNTDGPGPDDNGGDGTWGSAPDGPWNDGTGGAGGGYDPNDPSTWGSSRPRGELTPDSNMGGGSHAWATGSARTGFGSGGIGAAGAGLGGLAGGAGSAAVLGGAGGAVSLAGAKLMQTGAPASGTGLMGSGGSGSAAASGAAGAAGSRGGAVGMMGGAGAAGGASDKKSRAGLLGLRAPQLDGDDDPVPRSEAAGAGGRDS